MGTSGFDPTYPSYPIIAILSGFALLLVLLTSLVRKSWNLGVSFLCVWLLIEIVFGSIAYFVWFDNGEIRLYAFCDIRMSVVRSAKYSENLYAQTLVSRIQLICYVIKPMATLLISRRLYLIASLRSVEYPSTRAVRTS